MIKPLRFYVHKVLPLVYDDSLSYYELLGKVISKLNEVITSSNELSEDVYIHIEQYVDEWLEEHDIETIVDERVDALLPQIDQLRTDTDQNMADIDTLENTVGRQYLFIGDSYLTDGRGGYDHAYATTACFFLGATIGVNAYKFSAGGAGFIGDPNATPTTFNDLVNQAYTALGSATAALITDVIIAGGCNDSFGAITAEMLNTAKDTCIANVFSKFPNCRLFISCIGGFKDYSQGQYLHNKVKNVYEYPGLKNVIPIINGHIPMLDHANYDGTDRVHPNRSGELRIGQVLGTAIKACSGIGSIARLRASMSFTWDSALSSHSGNIFYYYNTNRLVIDITSIGVTFTDNITITYNNGLKFTIGEINTNGNGIVSNASDADMLGMLETIPCVIQVYKNDSDGFLPVFGYLIFWYDSTTGKVKIGVKAYTANVPSEGLQAKSFRIECAHAAIAYS